MNSPAENLALDEALLLEAEKNNGEECLRFWMSPVYFVALGLGARTNQEVHRQTCEARRIPLLRRCSGGGTVVQGPGCLNYSLVLGIAATSPTSSIHAANQFVMKQHAQAFAGLLAGHVEVQGHTDLTLDGRKFSGNAQRRLRRRLLFHGTFLLNFDLSAISELLPLPGAQPDYRRSRPHEDFLTNLNLSAQAVKQVLREVWGADGVSPMPPRATISHLVSERYGRDEWNLRT